MLTFLQSIFQQNSPVEKSKERWNVLANKNSRYYIYSDKGKSIQEKDFKKSGNEDYVTLIKNDSIFRVCKIDSAFGI